MIVDILFAIATTFLTLLAILFSAINFVVPQEISSSLQIAFSYLRYFNGILPMDTFLRAGSILMTFYIAYFVYKVVLWIYSALPWFGKQVKHNDD